MRRVTISILAVLFLSIPGSADTGIVLAGDSCIESIAGILGETEAARRAWEIRRISDSAIHEAILALERCQIRKDFALYNLAHQSTAGFKRIDPWTLLRDFTQGSFRQTENQFHVAIEGGGFFQVELPDGSIFFTRCGAFELDSRGSLVTHDGFYLESKITVPANALTLEINSVGTVTAQDPTGSLIQLGTIQLTQFVNPAGLQPVGTDLYRETASSGAPTTSSPGTIGTGLLRQGFVEESNVRELMETETLERLKKEETCLRWALERFGYRLP